MTIREFFNQNNKDLDKNQSRDFAWLLVSKLKSEPISWDLTTIPAKILPEIKRDLKRLKNNEPLGYILGTVPFVNCELSVTPDVLIPRSETEQLCDMIIQEYAGVPTTILDICTGSGCIAVALGKNLDAVVSATDISESAIKVAIQNAMANNVAVNFYQCDLVDDRLGKFDLIVSNPPYLDKKEMDTLPASVRDFEPKLALFGGEDGLDFYRKLSVIAPKHLNAGGVMYLEVGDYQADKVAEILSENFDCDIVADYYGFDRFVIARSKK